MMISALATVCLLNRLQSGDHTEVHWPVVPEAQFALNGIDSNGNASLHHAVVKLGEETPRTPTGGMVSTLTVPPGSKPWETFQLAFSYTAEGTLAKFGGISLTIKGGKLWFVKGAAVVEIGPVASSDLNDIQIVRRQGSLLAYLNGNVDPRTITSSGSVLPVEIGLGAWRGAIIGVSGYARRLSVDERFANERGAQALAKLLFSDTPKVTVEGELTATTPVPELERIRPYRSALLAEEYKVIRIVAGRSSAIKPGMKIRIFRYGIKAGVKTAVKDAKVGDHTQMLIAPYDSDPHFSREFQVDGLDPDISIPLYVDVTPEK